MRVFILPLALLAVACGEELSPEEQQAKAARDSEMVRQANSTLPPLREITPDPILYPDIERHDLYGMACNYAPGTSLGTRVVAREADAFMKIDGEVVRFAADPGSRQLPMRTRSLYNGRAYSLRLVLEDADEDAAAAPAENGAVNYEGTVLLRDRWDRIIYRGSGLAQCSN